MCVDGFLHRARMNGLKWAESESAGVFQAVDYAGDQFQPRILCHRIVLSHSARTRKYAEIFWVEGFKAEFRGRLADLEQVIVRERCRTKRTSFE